MIQPLSNNAVKRFTALHNILQIDASVDSKKIIEQFNKLEAAFGALQQDKITRNEFFTHYPGLKKLKNVDIKIIRSSIWLIGVHAKAYKNLISKTGENHYVQ